MSRRSTKATRDKFVQDFVKSWARGRARFEAMRRRFAAEAGCEVTIHPRPEKYYWNFVIIQQGLAPALRKLLGPEAAVLGPMGLYCDLTVVANLMRTRSPSLELRFTNYNKASLHFVLPSVARQAKFAPGSLGAINGGNRKSIPIPDDFTVGQLVDLLLAGRRAQRKFFKTLLS
jgi:hypothetical protein